MRGMTRGVIGNLMLATRYTFWCRDRETGTIFDMGISAPFAATKACRDDVAKVNPERYEYGPPQIVGTPAHDFTKPAAITTVPVAPTSTTCNCEPKAVPPVKRAFHFENCPDYCRACAFGTCNGMSHPVKSETCCLPWCTVPTVDHDAARTERCLDYAIKREAINARMRDFRDRLSRFSRPGSIDSEIEWASEKTGKELNALEDQWRSLDPDRVGES